MNFIFSISFHFLAAAATGFIFSFLVAVLFDRSVWRTVAPLLLALAFVGACAGVSGGMSRMSAVGEIIPAFLGLLGAVAIYLFGVDQSRGTIASFAIASLAISLLVGYAAGADLRKTPEDHRDIRAHCVRAYTDADLLKDQVAFDRFRAQMGNLCLESMYWEITEPES